MATLFNGEQSFCFFFLFVCFSIFVFQCLEYGRVWAFSGLCIPIKGQDIIFCPYTGKYGSGMSPILAYFTQYVVKAQLLISLTT